MLDTGLFVAIYVASRPTWTGIAVHEWLAFLLIVPALLHLIVNWDWVMRAVPRFVRKLSRTSRLNLAVDTLLFASIITVTVSGVVLLPRVISLDFTGALRMVWLRAHQISSDLTIVSLLLHTALHINWIANAISNRGYLPKAPRHSAGFGAVEEEAR